MTREAMRSGAITEGSLIEAMLHAKGDIFVASCILGCTARELDAYIRASEDLQGFVAAIATVKKNPEYERMSNEQFSDELDRLTRSYRLEALGIIHEIATMPTTTAADRDVKLKAAINLRGSAPDRVADNSTNNVLAELNEMYLQNAQRIKSVRIQTAQIEFEGSEQSGIRVIDQRDC